MSSTSRAVLRCVTARVVPAAVKASGGPDRLSRLDDSRSVDQSTAPYRSAARRLRGRFADNPGRLQRSLLELARGEDARREDTGERTDQAVRALHGMVDGKAAERFAVLVAQHLDGPVLCYEDRQSLLEAADQLGIGRFEANLIIAAVQHRAEGEHVAVRSATVERSRVVAKWWPAVTVVLAVEMAVSLVAWWAMRG